MFLERISKVIRVIHSFFNVYISTKPVLNVVGLIAEVKVVKNVTAQMAASSDGNKRPTVAVITSKYYEKLAVDAMMTNKTTFVRYKTEGMVVMIEYKTEGMVVMI